MLVVRICIPWHAPLILVTTAAWTALVSYYTWRSRARRSHCRHCSVSVSHSSGYGAGHAGRTTGAPVSRSLTTSYTVKFGPPGCSGLIVGVGYVRWVIHSPLQGVVTPSLRYARVTVWPLGQSFSCTLCFFPLFSPSSFVFRSYFILVVPMLKFLGKHSCVRTCILKRVHFVPLTEKRGEPWYICN